MHSFDNQTVDHKGVTTRFFRKVDRFLVETDGPDGRLTTYPVKYAVGVWPLQQYLFDTGQGRLQVLDYAWDVDQKRWIHLYPDADTSPGNAFHWTGTYKNWQTRCAECHQECQASGVAAQAAAGQQPGQQGIEKALAAHAPGRGVPELLDRKVRHPGLQRQGIEREAKRLVRRAGITAQRKPPVAGQVGCQRQQQAAQVQRQDARRACHGITPYRSSRPGRRNGEVSLVLHGQHEAREHEEQRHGGTRQHHQPLQPGQREQGREVHQHDADGRDEAQTGQRFDAGAGLVQAGCQAHARQGYGLAC